MVPKIDSIKCNIDLLIDRFIPLVIYIDIREGISRCYTLAQLLDLDSGSVCVFKQLRK